MKKNFLTGLLGGIGGTLALIAITGVIYVSMEGTKISGLNDVKAAVVEQNDEAVPYEDIVNKLTTLEGLVDYYYLNDTDNEAYADGIYKGFIDTLGDPYSVYYTAEEYAALQESSSGLYCGIGATVSQDPDTGIITIVKPFEDGPAYKAGILPGDILYKVDKIEVTGDDLSAVVSKMKGTAGTKVAVTVVRDGEDDPIDITITRAQIEVPTIEYQMLSGKIGYIIISEFDEVTVTQFKAAVTKLEKQGMKGLVVDVRNNPGGLLDSVVQILDRLLPKELIVYTEDKYGNRVEENAEDAKKIKVPMAVLINGNSASAAEIFAGTLQDYKVATIVGTTSFGKGIVQSVIPLTDGTAVKLTISKYYTPLGRNIHGIGITPDVEIELDDKLKQQVVIEITEDNQLQKAIKIIKGKIK
ncbi:MAG: S41 family peptidase [Mobilitalea sp.]